jgi:high-affinity iron transporter
LNGVFATGAIAAGFFAVFREGIEISLAMSLLASDTGWRPVIEGMIFGLTVVALTTLCFFLLRNYFRARLILVASGVLIAGVSIIYAGYATRLLQATDWVPISPLPVTEAWSDFFGWVGFSATWEAVAGMSIVGGLIAGSYFLPRLWPTIRLRLRKR